LPQSGQDRKTIEAALTLIASLRQSGMVIPAKREADADCARREAIVALSGVDIVATKLFSEAPGGSADREGLLISANCC